MNAPEFTALYREHDRKLYYFILTMSRNREQAEDIVSRAFLAAWTHRLELNGNFKPWLYQIAVNELKTDWRKPSYGKTMPITEDHHNIADPINPVRAAELRDEWNRAQHAATDLPRKLRRIIVDLFRGMDLKQSARVRRIPYGTAGRRLFEARRQVRELCRI